LDFSVVIVNYRTPELLLRAIRSVLRQGAVECEVLVVDNASGDGSAERVRELFPDIRLFALDENVGFSRANNLALREARGENLVLLNPDAELLPGALVRMKAFLAEHPEAGIAGGRVVRPDGSLDPACRRSFPTPAVAFFRYAGLSRLFPRSRVFGRYNLTYLDPGRTYPVDSVVGAYMVIRRRVLEEIGLLDEDFFMYGEDLDLCYRAREAGWQVYYVHDSVALHEKGGAGRPPAIIREFFRSQRLFYRKHYARRHSRLTGALVAAGIWLGEGASLLRARS